MTLVVGFSPGRADKSSLQLGAMLARSRGTDLRMVAVVPTVWPTPVARAADREYEEYLAQRGEQAVAMAKEWAETDCPDIDVEVVWVSGRSSASTLLAEAEKVGAELIVVGSAQHGAWGHIVVGSTADRLLHSSPIPVAVAPRGFRTSEDDTKVLRATCAFRGDETSRSTARTTAEICAQVGASLRLATYAIRRLPMYPAGVSGAEDMVLDRFIEQSEATQKEVVAGLADTGLDPASVEMEIGVGADLWDAIEQLEWKEGDVMVIGSSPERLVARLFLGSSATKIIRHSPVPVIVVQ